MVQVAGDERTSDSWLLITRIMRPRYGMSEWVSGGKKQWNAELHPILTRCHLLFASEHLRNSIFTLKIIDHYWAQYTLNKEERVRKKLFCTDNTQDVVAVTFFPKSLVHHGPSPALTL